jgi:hypothetical protein
MSNKDIVKQAQSILKELGHEISLGHVYELLSRLAGFDSYNVAKTKGANLDPSSSRTLRSEEISWKPKPKNKSDRGESGYTFKFHKEDGTPIPFKGEANVTFELCINGYGTTIAEAARAAIQNFEDELEGYGNDCRTLEHNIVDVELDEEPHLSLAEQYEVGISNMVKQAKLSFASDGTVSSQQLRNALAAVRLIEKDLQEGEQKKNLLKTAKELVQVWREALARHNSQVEFNSPVEKDKQYDLETELEKKNLSTSDIKDIFKTVFKGKTNIMTPEVIRYGKKGEHVYELSKGEGMNREPLFGVTVLTTAGERTDLGQAFSSLGMAENYIKNL